MTTKDHKDLGIVFFRLSSSTWGGAVLFQRAADNRELKKLVGLVRSAVMSS